MVARWPPSAQDGARSPPTKRCTDAGPDDRVRLPRPCPDGLRRPGGGGRRAGPAGRRRCPTSPTPRSSRAGRAPGRAARRARHRGRGPGRDRVAQRGADARRRSSGCAARGGCSSRSTSGSSRDEVRYIVEHSGARVLLVDPEVDAALTGVPAEHRFVLGDDDALLRPGGLDPAAVGARRERDGDDQLHLRHDRPAQGRPDHPPQHLDQRADLRPARRASPTATCTCTPSRCSTPTAGGCRSRRPASGSSRSSCARWTAPRSSAASSSTA